MIMRNHNNIEIGKIFDLIQHRTGIALRTRVLNWRGALAKNRISQYLLAANRDQVRGVTKPNQRGLIGRYCVEVSSLRWQRPQRFSINLRGKKELRQPI